MSNFKCPICGNSDSRFIGFKNGKEYCRKCISFNGESAKKIIRKSKPCKINIAYTLTIEQEKISKQTIEAYLSGKNSLLYAVCGAGKTELVYGVIAYALSKGQQVGFAIPRREVVIELFDRLKNAFSNNEVVSVYGGHNDKLDGELIVLTTHQLYRYVDYFDLLIIDEIDAFPFKDNDVLNSFFFRSVKGNYIMMSATPNDKIIKHFSEPGNCILTLKTRYHHMPIPIPKYVTSFGVFKFLKCINYLKRFIKERKQVFIFAPTIQKCETAYHFISLFVKNGDYVHSKVVNRESILKRFKDKKLDYLVTTSILERGITVKSLQVIVLDSDHDLYDEYSLIQIAGRVGRKSDDAKGEVIFLAEKETDAMEHAVNTIKQCNGELQNMLSKN